MYLHLGNGKIINTETLIGIFDLDITSQSYLTRQFLTLSEKAGHVINAAEDIPKSFVVCSENGKKTVYLSQMASATLLKRSEESIM